MNPPVIIVGQGVAGSLLAWELLHAGVEFRLFDRGHAASSSRVGAGIINPVTGQRLVKSWRVESWLPPALETYRAIERALELPLVFPFRIRRFFRDDRERRIYAEKRDRGDLVPFLGPEEADGFWVEGAWRVDTARLIAGLRKYFRAAGCLREEEYRWGESPAGSNVTVACTGHQLPGWLEAMPLVPAFGEIVTIRTPNLAPDVILNQGHWVLPIEGGMAKVGATFAPQAKAGEDLPSRAEELVESAERILARPVSLVGRDTGWRVTTPDKHPLVGRCPAEPRWGYFGGLGSKGALLAPSLAKIWRRHLVDQVPFPSEVGWGRWGSND